MKTNRDYQKELLHYFKLFTCISLATTIYRIYRDFSKNILDFPSPSIQIIPTVKYLRSELQFDLFSFAQVHSPHFHTAFILDKLLPQNNETMLASFVVLDKYLCGIFFSLIIFIISLIISLIYFRSDQKLPYRFFFHNNLIILITSFIVFLAAKRFDIIANLPIVIIPALGWYYPPNYGPNPSGIALISSLISLLLSLLLISRWIPNTSQSRLIVYFFSILFFAFSVYIHPVVPLAIIVISIFIKEFVPNNHFKNFWNNYLISCAIIWIVSVFIINLLYSEFSNISAIDLFRIYVENRHPWHYLPSYYIKVHTFLEFFVNIIIVISLLFIFNRLKIKNKYSIKLFLKASFLALFLTLIQFLGVEFFNIPIFIKLGLSRLSYLYGFFYLLSLIYSLFSLTIFYSNSQIKSQFNNFHLRFFSGKTNFKYLLTLLILLLLISTNLTKSLYINTKEAISTSPTFKLVEKLSSNNVQINDNFIFLDSLNTKFKNPREIGGINVFYDKFFPSKPDVLLEWEKRGIQLEKINKCYLQKKHSKCFKELSKKKIFIVSKNLIPSNQQILDFKLDDTEIYISKPQ